MNCLSKITLKRKSGWIKKKTMKESLNLPPKLDFSFCLLLIFSWPIDDLIDGVFVQESIWGKTWTCRWGCRGGKEVQTASRPTVHSPVWESCRAAWPVKLWRTPESPLTMFLSPPLFAASRPVTTYLSVKYCKMKVNDCTVGKALRIGKENQNHS